MSNLVKLRHPKWEDVVQTVPAADLAAWQKQGWQLVEPEPAHAAHEARAELRRRVIETNNNHVED